VHATLGGGDVIARSARALHAPYRGAVGRKALANRAEIGEAGSAEGPMLDVFRTTLYRVIESPRGDAIAALRLPKMLARSVNELLGSPLCSAEELAQRRAAEAKLASLRGKAQEQKVSREPAPVVVYFEKDRNQRLIDRIRELLDARSIAYRMLDVTGDEPTQAFVVREAKCEPDDLPIVFVGGAPIGGYNDLVESDVSGALRTAIDGA
jgi:glutaredoxin